MAEPSEKSGSDLPSLIASIPELSLAELIELEPRLVAAVEKLTNDPGDEDLVKAQEYVEAVLKIRELRGERRAKAKELLDRLAPEPEPEPEVEEEPAEPSVGVEPEPVAAAVKRPPLSEVKVPERHRPKPRKSRFASTIIASGQELVDTRQLLDAFGERLRSMQLSARGSRQVIASVHASYPWDRQLGHDAYANQEKIDKVCSPQALVAAGGLCAPVGVSYEMDVISTDDRPVRDTLARFNADRGGIQFIAPPSLGDLVSGTQVTTEAQDTSGTTKPVVTIACGTATEEVVDAVSARMRWGNFGARFFPEQIRANLQLLAAEHARLADSRLLQRIAAGSTAISDGQNLGASRDLLESYGRLGAQFRSRHRMRPDALLQVILPAWVRDMIQADLLRQMPGDDTFAASYERIDAMFRVRNLAVAWHLDTETGAATNMIYQAQTAGAGIGWRASVIGYLFTPGSWLHLDGGRLDLGAEIRDSTLNASNNVESFMETFEGVARVGQQSLKITNTVCVSGEAQATVDAFTCPTSGS